MQLVTINGEREVLGRNAAVKLIIAMEHCPRCGLLPEEHDDEYCDMRYSFGLREEQWLP
jgi:hypothetical protein